MPEIRLTWACDNGLPQDCCNSSANALELMQFLIKPLICRQMIAPEDKKISLDNFHN